MKNPDIIKYDQGMLFWYTDDIDDKTNGERGVLKGNRPVMILSVVSNKTSTCTVTCLPLTTSSTGTTDEDRYSNNPFYKVPVDMPGGKKSYICCNQPMNIATNHLTSYIGQCASNKFLEVQVEFLRYLGLLSEDVVEIKRRYAEMVSTTAVQPVPYDEAELDLETEPESDNKITKFTFARAVACLEDGYIFKNKSEAARYYNIDRIAVRKSAANKSTIQCINKTFTDFK